MPSEQHHLDITVKASYRTLNKLTKDTERIWIVFHGYGQLTEYFIKKFDILDPMTNFILAPQGLSKFYLNGFDGRVGATWMTKEDRLTEIENQQHYLNAVFAETLKTPHNAEIILFGFSQGVATMGRFITLNKVQFQKMVLWAGTLPHEIGPEDISHWPKQYEIAYFTGTKDPFLKEGMIEAQKQRIKSLTGKEIEPILFDGKHEVVPELLLQI